MNKPFDNPVLSPWRGNRDSPTEFYPKTIMYQEGNYFIAKQSEDCYLYFIKKGGKYYAFNQLAGFRPSHINTVIAILNGAVYAEEWSAKRGAETILAWD